MIEQCPRCERIVSDGACSAHPEVTLRRAVFGRYVLSHRLGKGAYGDVFAGHDAVLERTVAIKILQSTSGKDVARFRREGQALSALSKDRPHPHLVQVHDIDLEGPVPWMAMQLVDGTTLANHLKDGPRPISEARTLFAQAADALDHIHSHGWVHRDIKPANIMIERTANGLNMRLVDLGIVLPLHDAPALTDGHAPRTPAYAGPEWGEGDAKLEPAYDVYSLGVCLYETISGVNPFLARSWVECLARHRTGLSKRLADAVQGVDPALDNLVAQMLATDPAARPTAAQVRDGLRSPAVDVPTVDEPDAQLPGASVPPASGVASVETTDQSLEAHLRLTSRAPWIGLFALLVMALGVGAFVAMRGPEPSPQDAALPPPDSMPQDAALPPPDSMPQDAASPDAASQPVVVMLMVPGGRAVRTHLVRSNRAGQVEGLQLQERLRSNDVAIRMSEDEDYVVLKLDPGITLIRCDGKPIAGERDLLECFDRAGRRALIGRVKLETSGGSFTLVGSFSQ